VGLEMIVRMSVSMSMTGGKVYVCVFVRESVIWTWACGFGFGFDTMDGSRGCYGRGRGRGLRGEKEGSG
jgi:hypothetical protein